MPKRYKPQFDGRGKYVFGKSAAIFAADFYDELFNLIMNAVKIKNLSFADEAFVKRELFERGHVGFYDDLFYRVIVGEVDPVGEFPKNVTLVYKNGNTIAPLKVSYERGIRDEVRFIFASPSRRPLCDYLLHTAEILGYATASIRQNLRATMTPAIYVTSDADLRLSIENAIYEKEDGASAIVVNSDVGATLKGVKCETEYIADKVLDLRARIYKEVLKRLGVPNSSNKREREQSAEIYADIADTVDSIYTIVDTWNAQMRDYELPFEMELNGILPEIENAFISAENAFISAENNEGGDRK